MSRKSPTRNPALAKSPVIAELTKASASETAARAFIEKWRWNGEPWCPHCGDTDTYRMTGKTAEKRGLHRCHGCKRQFTVKVGTIFEDSALPLHKWCRAIWEASKAKNGVSALELARTLQITHKSALFMLNRLRWAMAQGSPDGPRGKLTGDVECDETYVGGRPRGRTKAKRGRGTKKQPVAACVQRGGNVRTEVIACVNSHNVRSHVLDSVCPTARLHTDMESSYRGLGAAFEGGHHTVNHGAGEYVRYEGDGFVTTNTAEAFFSRVKRSLNGTYHAVSREHLHRYMSQFEFAHNTRKMNDGDRAVLLLRMGKGQRLTYRESTEGQAA